MATKKDARASFFNACEAVAVAGKMTSLREGGLWYTCSTRCATLESASEKASRPGVLHVWQKMGA